MGDSTKPNSNWIKVTCPTCRGSGTRGVRKCGLCKGKGVIRVPPERKTG